MTVREKIGGALLFFPHLFGTHLKKKKFYLANVAPAFCPKSHGIHCNDILYHRRKKVMLNLNERNENQLEECQNIE